jgi:hypothetical protein
MLVMVLDKNFEVWSWMLGEEKDSGRRGGIYACLMVDGCLPSCRGM